jgi:hypothetical protein
MKIIKIRYKCGHEVDFDTEVSGAKNPSTLREKQLATEQANCPACRHDSVRVQLVSSKRIRQWK